MRRNRGRAEHLGSDFARLWGAYTVSEVGSAVGAGALPLIAVLLVHASSWQVSLLAALSGITSAALALPLGPAIERRRKRPVMIAADVARAFALASIPLAAWAGRLEFVQLCVVGVICSTAAISFGAASGAHLKALVPPGGRAAANSRFESTFWLATSLGTPLGGLLISWLGATVTVVVDATSYVLSALGVRSIRRPEPPPPTKPVDHRWRADIVSGWTTILRHRGLRALFFNSLLFGGAVMMASPLETVLMLRDLGFEPWEYGLVLGIPCLGGFAGAAIMPRLVARHGERFVLLVSGAVRTLWVAPIAAASPGPFGVVLITGSGFLLLFFAGIFNPAFATYRMQETADGDMARVLTAWSVSSRSVQPLFILVGGALATATTTRTAIGVAGVLLLCSAALLPWRADEEH